MLKICESWASGNCDRRITSQGRLVVSDYACFTRIQDPKQIQGKVSAKDKMRLAVSESLESSRRRLPACAAVSLLAPTVNNCPHRLNCWLTSEVARIRYLVWNLTTYVCPSTSNISDKMNCPVQVMDHGVADVLCWDTAKSAPFNIAERGTKLRPR